MQFADVCVLVIIALAVLGAVVLWRRQKKKGCGCHGGCASCDRNCRYR